MPPPQLLAAVLVAPPATDRLRFPPHEYVNGRAWFAYRFRQRLKARSEWELDWANVYRVAYEQSYPNWWAWELLYKCHGCEGQRDWQKRLLLAELEQLLGPEDYAAGRMPECVPGWMFHDLR